MAPPWSDATQDLKRQSTMLIVATPSKFSGLVKLIARPTLSVVFVENSHSVNVHVLPAVPENEKLAPAQEQSQTITSDTSRDTIVALDGKIQLMLLASDEAQEIKSHPTRVKLVTVSAAWMMEPVVVVHVSKRQFLK